jgi:hypothetical protein
MALGEADSLRGMSPDDEEWFIKVTFFRGCLKNVTSIVARRLMVSQRSAKESIPAFSD